MSMIFYIKNFLKIILWLLVALLISKIIYILLLLKEPFLIWNIDLQKLFTFFVSPWITSFMYCYFGGYFSEIKKTFTSIVIFIVIIILNLLIFILWTLDIERYIIEFISSFIWWLIWIYYIKNKYWIYE